MDSLKNISYYIGITIADTIIYCQKNISHYVSSYYTYPQAKYTIEYNQQNFQSEINNTMPHTLTHLPPMGNIPPQNTRVHTSVPPQNNYIHTSVPPQNNYVHTSAPPQNNYMQNTIYHNTQTPDYNISRIESEYPSLDVFEKNVEESSTFIEKCVSNSSQTITSAVQYCYSILPTISLLLTKDNNTKDNTKTILNFCELILDYLYSKKVDDLYITAKIYKGMQIYEKYDDNDFTLEIIEEAKNILLKENILITPIDKGNYYEISITVQ